ncbi:MAG: ABC transporter ATP-binding protein [Micrococcaceae bacterium]
MTSSPHTAAQGSRLSVLWSFARPHSRTLLFALVLGLIASAGELATPMVTKWILDSLADGQGLGGPVAALVVLLVVGASIGLWQWIILGTLAEDVVLGARRRMISRYLRAKVLPLLGRPSGELVTRVTSDSVLLREAASSSLVGLVNGAVMLVGTLVLMGVLDLVLLGTTLVTVAVVTVLFLALMPPIAKAQERAQAALADLGSGVEGTVRAIKTVKAAGAEDRQYERLMNDAVHARRHGVVAVRREAVAWTVAWTGIQAAIILILALGAARVAAGEMEVSTLVAFLLYAFGLMGPIMELSQNTTALQAGIAAAGRIREIDTLEAEGETVGATATASSASSTAPAPQSSLALCLNGVRARYGPDQPWALEDVTIEVPRRGHVAIVGPSGAGKTSVLSAVLRFLEISEGEIAGDGVSYRELSPRAARTGLAYVEQETPVVPGTVRENLLFANPDATENQVREVLTELRLDEAIARMPEGLDTRLSDTSVSGGQRQRIALARALLAEPRLLLLDEATAQVDGITEAAIHRAIQRQAARGAVLTIAHRLSTVVDADQIVVMDGGHVAARGRHHELLGHSPLYRELVAALSIDGGDQPSASEADRLEGS